MCDVAGFGSSYYTDRCLRYLRRIYDLCNFIWIIKLTVFHNYFLIADHEYIFYDSNLVNLCRGLDCYVRCDAMQFLTDFYCLHL